MAKRKYTSSLREDQSRATRRRILEGAARITLLDVSRLSHASVARVAEVSERTVYRHFPTVADLHDAFSKFQQERFGNDRGEEFDIDDLPAMYERWPERLAGDAGLEELLSESKEPPIVTRSRRERYARLESAIAPLVPGATKTQLRQLVLVVGALVSPEVFRRGKLIMDLAPTDIVPGPAWALRVLIEKLREGDTPWT